MSSHLPPHELDPYASPPGVDETHKTDPSTYKLHPLRAVVWATVFGSLVAGGVVLAINFWRLGKPRAAWLTLVLATVITGVILFALYSSPSLEQVPDWLFWVVQLNAAYGIAFCLQNKSIKEHVKSGGQMASTFRSVGIGLLCFVPVVALVIGIEAYYYNLTPTELVSELTTASTNDGTYVFGDDEIYCVGDANESDANELAKELITLDYFGYTPGSGVQLELSDGQWTISFVFISSWSDPEVTQVIREIGNYLAEFVYQQPIRIQICDQNFVTKFSANCSPEETESGWRKS